MVSWMWHGERNGACFYLAVVDGLYEEALGGPAHFFQLQLNVWSKNSLGSGMEVVEFNCGIHLIVYHFNKIDTNSKTVQGLQIQHWGKQDIVIMSLKFPQQHFTVCSFPWYKAYPHSIFLGKTYITKQILRICVTQTLVCSLKWLHWMKFLYNDSVFEIQGVCTLPNRNTEKSDSVYLPSADVYFFRGYKYTTLDQNMSYWINIDVYTDFIKASSKHTLLHK